LRSRSSRLARAREHHDDFAVPGDDANDTPASAEEFRATPLPLQARCKISAIDTSGSSPQEVRKSKSDQRLGVARPEGIEPPAYRFEACRSIQLSYGRPEQVVERVYLT